MNSVTIEIRKCSFTNIESNEAACFYIGSSTVSIKYVCCLHSCIRKNKVNDCWGNAYQISVSTVNEDHISVLQCSYSNEYKADAAICLKQCKSQSSSVNVSKCHGFGGGNICYRSNTELGSLSYSSICESLDHCAIESYHALVRSQFTNFINTTKCAYTIYADTNTNTFIDCIFINLCSALVYDNLFNCITLERCFFDASIAKTSVQVNDKITENIKEITNVCKTAVCTHKVNRQQHTSFIKSSILFILNDASK